METSTPREGSTIGRTIAWILFCATCVQFVLFKSYVDIIPGIKADVFGGVLCAFTLAVCLLTADRSRIRITWPEVLISLVLLALTLVAGFLSSLPWSSSVIGLVFASTGLGGYWCARLTLDNDSRQRRFAWLCAIILGVYVTGALWGYLLHGTMDLLVHDTHQVANLIILLSFAPLALLVQPSFFRKIVAVVVLAPCAVMLYVCGLSGVEAGVLIPMAVVVPAAFIGSVRSRNRAALFALLLVMAAVTSHYVSFVSNESFSRRAYQADRIEYYPFSLHIAKQNPLFGIGLRTPREEYLNDYEMRHPYYSKSAFAQEVSRLKVCQNQFLTLMVGLGIPFVILYLMALVTLVVRLVRTALRPSENTFLSPLVLLVPVCGGILYLLIMDFLMLAQISWFFHILLGLIPAVAVAAPKHEETRAWGTGSLVGCLAAVALGILVGTHPAIRAVQLPSVQEIWESFKSVPVVGPLLDQPQRQSTEEAAQPSTDGQLVVTIKDYEGSVQKWAVMCILDTSKSMTRASEPWNPNRLHAAVDFIARLGQSLPEGSTIGVRGFGTVGPVRRKGGEIGLRVSRLLVDWTNAPAASLAKSLSDISPPGEYNICAAAESSLERDFELVGESLAGRIAVLTDGNSDCALSGLADRIVAASVRGRRVVLDTIGIGMNQETVLQQYQEAAGKTHGIFFETRGPEDTQRLVSEYVGTLSKPTKRPLVVSGNNKDYEALPEDPISLPSGTYTVTMPELRDLNTSAREVKEVVVRPGERTILNVSIDQGHLRVERK